MEWIFQWVKNITYYLVFICLVSNLLPDTRYERYIKLFCGVVFILLVISPLTAGLKLDQVLARVYEELCFERDTADFEDRLWGIEAERVERIFAQYEEAVSQDIQVMAEEAGFSCRQVRAQIEKQEGEEHFGQVVAVELVLERSVPPSDAVAEAGADVRMGGAGHDADESRTVESIKIQVELDDAGADSGQALAGAEREDEDKGQEALYGFQRKVAGYYGLEEKAVRITWKDD